MTAEQSRPEAELANWLRVRRYAVPRWMIEQATERRLAGDWRGACEAAGFEVAFDLKKVRLRHGTPMAERLAEDLRHLVPDLVRWHLPRISGRTTIATGRPITLVDYDTSFHDPREANLCCAGHCLYVAGPLTGTGPQRLRLGFGPPGRNRPGTDSTRLLWPPHLWDDRHTAELLQSCGGGDRAPFFHRDGTPLAQKELPSADPGPGDPVRHTEWVTLLQEGAVTGNGLDAYAAAGIELDLEPNEDDPWSDPERSFRDLPVAPSRLRAEIAARLDGPAQGYRLQGQGYRGVCLRAERSAGGDLRIEASTGHPGLSQEEEAVEIIPEAVWRRLPDLDLLRAGVITPEELHPLVRSALFPDRPVPGGPIGPTGPAELRPVRVRCRDEWHELHMRDGVLTGPHTDEEFRREQALSALGGEVTGCFAAIRAWTEGHGGLPPELRERRDEVFLLAEQGDTPNLLRLLDAGLDPRVRESCRCTLLHNLHRVDHEKLLPRLLAAGMDVETRNGAGQTPLEAVSGEGASEALVQALLDAGARPVPRRP